MTFCPDHINYLYDQLKTVKLTEYVAATADEANTRMERYLKGDVVLPDPFIVAKNLFVCNVNNVLGWTGNKLHTDHCPACQYKDFFKDHGALEIDKVWLAFAAEATRDLFNRLNLVNSKN